MVQALGYGGQPVKEVIFNPSTSVTILRGQAIELILTGVKTTPNTAEKAPQGEQANSVAKSFVGVAMEDIEPETFGEMAIQGFVQIRPEADALSVGAAIGPDDAGDWTNDATHTMAVLLEASGAANQDLKSAYLNQAMAKGLDADGIGNAFGGA